MKTYEEYMNHPEIPRAMTMIEYYPLDQVATFTGIPERFIRKLAKITGREKYLADNETKINLSPLEFYESLVPAPIKGETQGEIIARIQDAILSYQDKCNHTLYHVRCSRCMKVLGGEKGFVDRDIFLKIAREIQEDMRVEDYDDPRNQVLRVFMDRLEDNCLSQ